MRTIKQIRRSSMENDALFESEVNILMQCDHPNILKMYEYFKDSVRFYLIAEYCSGGEVY